MNSTIAASKGPLGLLPDLDKTPRSQEAQDQPEIYKFTNLLTAALSKNGAQPNAAPAPGTYQVQPGDNLFKISKKLGIADPTALANFNNIKNPNQLSVGQTLKLPAGQSPATAVTTPVRRDSNCPSLPLASTNNNHYVSNQSNGNPAREKTSGPAGKYVVETGDNLWTISKKLGLADPSRLVQANGLDNPSQLRVGQVLQVPGTASPAAAKQVAALQSPTASKVNLAASTQSAATVTAKSKEAMVTASWYGGAHHGRLMANGQPFNMHADTVAHKSLPFGTEVNLTNPQNGQSAKGVVTDRGPFVRGRQLDVSYNLARKLGFLDSGVAQLKMQGG